MTQDPARVRSTLRSLLSALDYAHARGVIHRDVKAENVLFDDAERPLLADFGIALRRGFGPRVTTAGLAVGSTAYMAPEQARGEEVDHRADLYSVGVLAWEMLNGKLPFNAGDALSMAVMHAQDPVPRLPPALRHWQRFLDKALTKSPAQRYRNAQHMLEMLDRVPQRGAPSGKIPLMQRGLSSVGRWPWTVWIAIGLIGAALAGTALRNTAPDSQGAPDRFFRAARGDESKALPAPAATGATGLLADPTDAMLRAAPDSAADRWVVAAERQIRQQKLSGPKGDNAFDSLIAAWKTDPTHVRLPDTIGAAITAFGADAEKRLRAGDDARAIDDVKRALALAGQTGQQRNPAVAAMRQRTSAAVATRVDQAVGKFDRAGAIAAAKLYRTLQPDTAAGNALLARAQGIPQAGDRVPGDPAGVVLTRVGDSLLAAAPGKVTRDDYARFAAATGRAPALCRERASLLRIVKPRDWKAPGFEQTGNQPVVCVSWPDIEAYVRWMSQRSGAHYRLPTASEARALPQGGGARAVSEWSSDCSGACSQRVVTGHGWRGVGGTRSLDATRGYDDVGFRLVRDL